MPKLPSVSGKDAMKALSKVGFEFRRQVRRILKSFKMKHAKPYQVDYRKPEDADEKLKNPVQ